MDCRRGLGTQLRVFRVGEQSAHPMQKKLAALVTWAGYAGQGWGYCLVEHALCFVDVQLVCVRLCQIDLSAHGPWTWT